MKLYRNLAILSCTIWMLLFATAIKAVSVRHYPEVTIGIIVPVEIEAMKEIVQGFTTTLKATYPGKVNFIIQNAQGDINLQRTILQQFKQRQVNMIVPIGTSVTEMTINLNPKTPIVALAAVYSDRDRLAAVGRNVTNVSDEVNPEKQIKLIKTALPTVTKLVLIHSADQHAFEDAKLAVNAAKIHAITVQNLMVPQLPDLYTIGKQISKDAQAIFILKDEMIVSGTRTLANDAKQRHIPLISSDDGSVKRGAAFAIGVKESQIGIDGARLAACVLKGTPISNIPVKRMEAYQVFINPEAASAQGVNIESVKRAAHALGYPVIIIHNLAGA